MSSSTFLLVCTALLAAVSCEGEYGQVYCGRRLATTLAVLCEGGNLVKRSEPMESGWGWLAPRNARSLTVGKRQVVSECCDKPCTLDELLAYC
ncbi:bombyxin A-3 homolog [Battus philenor]|uniref:bombyxin A-3 homolog n=1 Tax=Battus philenor TaxID=42288 RepID=UPI0035CE8614